MAQSLEAPLFAAMPVVAMALHPDDLTVLATTDLTAHTLNSSREELIGRPAEEVFRLVPPDFFQRAGVTARQGRTETSHHTVRSGDGARVWHVTAQPVTDKAGVLICILCSAIEDRAIRHVHNSEMAHQDAARNYFLARMSHELRTPLNAVIGFAQVLERDNLNESQRDSIQQIVHAGDQLVDLIDDILEVAHLTTGSTALDLESVPLAQFVAEAVRMFSPLAQSREVTLRIADCDEAVVRADPKLLRQILQNFISNAIKYNRQGGSVEIGWRENKDDTVTFSVSDTGRGIAPRYLARLGQPFDRLDAERGEMRGTGLGLTLARAATEAMHGSLTVSTSEASGSVFSVTLPRA